MQKEANYIKYQRIQNVTTHIAKTKMYAHWSRISDTVPIIYIYCRMEFRELSRVNDAHFGHVRVPVRMNQVSPVTQGLQQIRRLRWDQ